MRNTAGEKRSKSFYALAVLFALFLLFLYGPTLTILVLSFQGPDGGLTFPMNGASLHWYRKLMEGLGVVDVWGAFVRSLKLGAVVMTLTVLFALAAGLAARKRFAGNAAIFYIAVASLIMPSIIVSLGIGLQFRLIDTAVRKIAESFGMTSFLDSYTTVMGMYTSGLGAHLTWTLPFGLLIMFAVFNRFNKSYEEAARDLGATPWQTFRYVVLPIIAASLVGIAMFGFTLSWDEIARSSQAIGDLNTLPMELQGLTTTVTNPAIYALGTLTTAVSFLVIGVTLAAMWLASKRKRGAQFDAVE
jgi:putative spermidine/putrescine transport system permease protein